MPSDLAVERQRKARELCRERGWGALMAYGNAWRCDYLRYVSDFPILEGHGVALMFAEGDVRLYLESPMEAERAAAEAAHCDVTCVPALLDKIVDDLQRAPQLRIAAVPLRLMPHTLVHRLGERLQDAGEAVDLMLMRKTAGEVDAVRRAARLADAGYELFRRAARPGVREYELIAEIEAFFRSQGCPDNFMIIGSGGQEMRGMHPPGERRLQRGDLVTTELTPCIDGYYAQICRTLVVGTPSPQQLAAFDVYREALEAGLTAVQPGVTAAEVARRENDVFRAHGLGEYTTNRYTRVRGHGVGLYVDSRPALLEDVPTPLEEGMTIIVHPNTYHPAAGYIVLGDSALVSANGAEVLTRLPRTLFSVPA